ncbi:NAD(P)/FAD-dependent oxidoreductase [Streptomyces sp. NBC_01381]|uniref:NAD(P)/FAD-dependent oxidoreductase n=1 Tax=Streptomyces sp. NBC_01381 TaxID=2903845 RepID=UPI002252CFBA|nr:NAD(P)/FAD-dependent oxidoreductase [Streptomyces sp. NBC_01381]MCX4667691.1 NAD(P)/FAD-dependent oxidoreductase [Streptomyces sp. NBC_01381]
MSEEQKTEKTNPQNVNLYDAVVIGGGASGLSTALILGRARRKVAVVDAGEPRNAPAAHMQGFLSRDGMPPAALLDVGRAEVSGYGAHLVEGRVDTVEPGRPGFSVQLSGGPVLHARHVVLATGLRDELPEIPGVRERWGRDVLHCPYCHGYEVRDRPFAVLGTHPNSVNQALLVRQWSEDIVYVPGTRSLTADDRERLEARGVRIAAAGAIVQTLTDDDRLHGVELANGTLVPCEVAFVFPRMIPNDGVLDGLGCARNEAGSVKTDSAGRTSVPGIWAVGNVGDSRALVISAAGTGAAAAFALNHDLVDTEVQQSVTELRSTRTAMQSGAGLLAEQ